MNLSEMTEEQLEALSQRIGCERDALRLKHLEVADELKRRRCSPVGNKVVTHAVVQGVVVNPKASDLGSKGRQQ